MRRLVSQFWALLFVQFTAGCGGGLDSRGDAGASGANLGVSGSGIGASIGGSGSSVQSNLGGTSAIGGTRSIGGAGHGGIAASGWGIAGGTAERGVAGIGGGQGISGAATGGAPSEGGRNTGGAAGSAARGGGLSGSSFGGDSAAGGHAQASAGHGTIGGARGGEAASAGSAGMGVASAGSAGMGVASAGSAGMVSVGLPTVDYVSPYVGYLGEQQGVVIRGSGFAGAATVLFGSVLAASVEVKSDTEIRAIPPAISAAGRQLVTVGNASGNSPSGADFVVRSHPTYAYAALTTDVGFQDRSILYDAERDAVFSYCSWFGNHSASTPSTINRYSYDQAGGTWSKTSTYVPSLWDIAMSPDGRYLIALGTSRLWLLDPVVLTTLGYVELTQASFGTARQLGVANDGKVLIRDLGVAYSLVRKTFNPVKFPSGIGIVFSGDGSRAVVGDANTSDVVPLSIYDASTGLVTPSQAFEYFQLPSMDRTGSRYFAGGNLRDRNLILIGGIPTFLGYLRPDGRRAYQVDDLSTHIRVYDLTGNGPTFPQLPDIVVADSIDGTWLHASLDSRFLFIAGPNRFIVVPLP